MSDNKRNNILKAAEALFKRKGYKNTSIAQIASEAGVSIRTIYSCFKSKGSMFEALNQPELLNYNPENENKKRFILKAALKVFAEKGYSDTTMDEVAASCGFSKAVLYRYFKGKTELFAAIFNDAEIFKGYNKFISEKPHLSLNDYLKYCGIQFLKFFENPYRLSILRVIEYDLNVQPQESKIMFENAIDKIINKVAERLVYYTCNGVIKNIDYKMAARSFFGILYSFILTDKIFEPFENKLDKEKITDFTIKMFEHGILNYNYR